jgi:hypothetical protein
MSRRVTLCNMQLAFIHSAHITKRKAEAALEDLFASGEVSECELAGDWIERCGDQYCILLKEAAQ